MNGPTGQDPPHTRPAGHPAPPSDPPTTPPDADADEFAAFYREYTTPLVAFLMQKGATLHDAVDIVQETMTAAWQTWARIEHPKAWAYTVASRAWIRRRIDVCETPVDPPPDPPPLLRHTEPVDLRLDLQRALPLLTERQRQVMAWHLHGHTGPEIADILGLSQATVRQHLSQARRTLNAWRRRKDGS